MYRNTNALESRLRLLTRAKQFANPLASVAQHPLRHIAYHVQPVLQKEYDSACAKWTYPLMQQYLPDAQVMAADIAFACAGVFVHKDLSIYEQADRSVIYPFLHENISHYALANANTYQNMPEPKAGLKASLTSVIGHDLVYRPKSGFVAPVREQYAHPAFLEILSEVTRNNPLAGLLDPCFIRQLVDDLSSKRQLAAQTYNFAWGVAFLSQWYAQAKPMK